MVWSKVQIIYLVAAHQLKRKKWYNGDKKICFLLCHPEFFFSALQSTCNDNYAFTWRPDSQ